MPYHSYIFFDRTDGSSQLPETDSFIKRLKRERGVHVESYATLGFKADTRFMLHINAAAPESIQTLVRDLLHTPLGKELRITYTLFGMTRPSQYNPKSAPKESAAGAPHRYLVVYPFTKTIEWHLLPYEERRAIMKAHVEVGRKHSDKISQRLLYSYGVDDHEFIVSYCIDDLEAFQTLVMEMRETQSRLHTKNDLPIFTCIHMAIEQALAML